MNAGDATRAAPDAADADADAAKSQKMVSRLSLSHRFAPSLSWLMIVLHSSEANV
jgi:hypothetical protein